jgi:hypothetical protein
MKPREPLDEGQRDMFRARLDQIIDMRHEKAELARRIDWRHLAERFGELYSDEPGRSALPVRLMAGAANAQIRREPVRRGSVRPVGGKPVLPIYLLQ